MACENSELTAIDHFIVDNKMVEIGSGAKRKPKDYNITRYACYIIAQNANPRLKKDNVDTEKKAYDTHNNIGKIVRKAIKEAGQNNARKFVYSYKKFKTA